MVAEKKERSAEAVERDREEASAMLAHAEGRDAEALTTLRSIARKEQGFSEAGDGIPAHEMLADILLELGRPKEALEEYEVDLHLNPNRFNALYGAARTAELAGNLGKATAYYTQLVQVCAGGNSGRVELKQARAWTAMKQE
jgi:tetratricopeptide (TPR) repeat protein